MKKILNKIGEALLRYTPFGEMASMLACPFAELAGALVMRDLRRWAKGYRAETRRGEAAMKPQTKINILIAIETIVIAGGALAVALLFISDPSFAFLLCTVALLISLFGSFYIVKRVTKLTWRGVWDYFWKGENDG